MLGADGTGAGDDPVGGGDRGAGRPAVDYAALFAATPTPYAVLTPDLVIAEVNPAYCRVTGRRREELVGAPLFEAFPAGPGSPDGVAALRASLERVRDTGQPDTMAVQRYDIADPAGGFAVRYWSPVNVPVLDERGVTALILNRVEDVTDYALARAESQASRVRGEEWRRRVEEAERDVFARAQELAEVNARLRESTHRERLAARRLAGLAETALALAGAQTVEALTEIVIGSGLAAMEADGGAVAVRDDERGVVRMTVTDSLGPETRRQYDERPLADPLPAVVAARTGETVLLSDRSEGLGWSESMAGVYAATGLDAWASLPLRAGGRLLGSLTIGWKAPQAFPPEEVELLAAFAAQCAQSLDGVQRRQAEREAATAARRLSETLQRSLLTAPPHPQHLQIAVRYLPAAQDAQVGGDWYDAFLSADGATTLAIGDVAGHDRDAAAQMGQVRNLLRGIAYTLNEPPAAVLTALDRALSGLAVDTLATAVLARVEQIPGQAATGVRRLRWSNAGHPAPLLVAADGGVELLSTESDLLLGLEPGSPRVDHEVDLHPGTTVVLYTDGLVERRNQPIDAGLGRLRAAAADLAGLPLEQLCDALLAATRPPGEGAGEDDVALVAVRAAPPPG